MFTEILTTAIAAMPALSQQGVPQNPQQANIDQAVQVLLNMAQASAQPGADGSCVIKLEGPEAIQAMQRLSAALNDSQPRTQGRPAPRQAGPRTMPMRHVVPAQQCQPAQRMGGQRAPQGQLKGSCSMRPAQVTIATEQKPMTGMRKAGFHHNQNGQCRKAAWLSAASRQGKMMRHHHMQSGQKPMMGMRKGGFHHNQNGQCRKAAWLSAACRQGKMMRHHHMQSGQKPMMGMRKGGFHHNRKAGMAPFQAAAMAPAPFCNMQKTFRGAPAAKQAPTINVFIINVNVAPQQGNKPCFGPNVGRSNCVSGNGMTPEAAAALQQIMPVLMNLGNCR